MMKYNNYAKDDLERLIERYFDGLTSVGEENDLRMALARGKCSSPVIDEARAVMGYFAAGKLNGRVTPAPHRYVSSWLKIAAAAAVVAVVTVTAMLVADNHGGVDSAVYLAYSGGNVITDPNEVAALAELQIGAVMEASRQLTVSVGSELQSLSEVLVND